MSPAYIPAILVVSSVLGPGSDVPVPKSNAQLDDAVRRFTRDRQRAVFDLTGGALTISRLWIGIGRIRRIPAIGPMRSRNPSFCRGMSTTASRRGLSLRIGGTRPIQNTTGSLTCNADCLTVVATGR